MTTVNWERWARAAGIVFVVLFVIGYIVAGDFPKIGETDRITSFYQGDRGRVLTGITIILFAYAIVMWFIGAIANVLRESGEGRLAATAIALGATFLGLQTMLAAIAAGLAQSIAAGTDSGVSQALNALTWNMDVASSFLLAGLILAVSVGLNRARILADWYCYLGIAAAVLVLLRGTNWATDGFWAPDGGYQFVAILASLGWTVVTSALLYMQSPATARVPETAAARPS